MRHTYIGDRTTIILADFSVSDWKDISIAHVINTFKSEVSPFPFLSYFSVVVCLRCLLHHILSLIAYTFRENREFIFHYYCAVYDECKYSDTFWLADRTRLFVQYTILLSSLCKLIWRHWTYEMPVGYILSAVWAILSIFSPLSIIQYVGLYVFSVNLFTLWWLREYIYIYFVLLSSSNRKYELLPIV